MGDVIGNMENGMPEMVFQCVIHYIDNSHDRDAVSLVCRSWYQIDAETRKHITIALCYTTTPQQLWRRFPLLESLKLKGQPRAAMFNLIPGDWGGHATPWVNQLATSFTCLTTVHFRRMTVTDANLEQLCVSRGNVLLSLKLDKCSGFSTDGLLHIARNCKKLKTWYLEESSITENDGEWLHELALNNTVLETLNFYLTYLFEINYKDLELIARNCPSLVSVKLCEYDLLDIAEFLRAANALQEFCGGTFNAGQGQYAAVPFPQRLRSLGLGFLSRFEMPIVYPFASRLTKLDLLYTLMDTWDHCVLIQRCPNLEVLEARNVIGDSGLEFLAHHCKKLKRLRIENGADEEPLGDEGGYISHQGLTALAEGCSEMEYVAVYVTDITNACLQSMGARWKKLNDFCLVLLSNQTVIADLPLDNGVRALLQGCDKLRRFSLYLREGALTDIGLGYVGRYSYNVRWMLLSCVGESDDGIIQFSHGCPNLQKLEMRACYFSERALAYAVSSLRSLKYFWIQGFVATADGRDLADMVRPFWNIEIIRDEHPHVLAYYSLAGQRTDFPNSVIPFNPAPFLG